MIDTKAAISVVCLLGLALGSACGGPAPRRSAESTLARDGGIGVAASSSTVDATPTPGLPELERARVRYALDSAGTLLDEWPGAKSLSACVHLYREDAEWLLDCGDFRNPSFQSSRETFGGSPVQVSTHPVFFYGATVPFKKLAAAFPATVATFNPDVPASAVYRTKPWFVVQAFDSLTRNHPAFDASTPTERWLGIFAHEYFHLSQMQRPRVLAFISAHRDTWRKKPDPGTQLMALFDDAAFKRGIEEEMAMLREPLERPSNVAEARAALRGWLALRKKRLSEFESRGPDAALELWENFELYVEGLGRYVENHYLVERRFHSDVEHLAADSRSTASSTSRGSGLPTRHTDAHNGRTSTKWDCS